MRDTGFRLDPDAGWHERRVAFGNQSLVVRANSEPSLLRQAAECADSLERNHESILKSLEELKLREGRRLSREAELAEIEIEAIDFFNPKRPTVGEVSFSEESGGEAWTCLFEGGRFFDLSSEA